MNIKKFLPSFLILLALFGYLLIGFNFNISLYDEGISDYLAMRVADGHIPYKDFWTIYSPGQFYCMAFLFKLFGMSLLVERVWTVIGIFLLSGSTFLILRNFVSKSTAIVGGMFILVWIGQLLIYGYAMTWGLFFSMLSAGLLFRYISEKNPRILVYCGFLNGITALFRHDIGYYNFIAFICFLFWFFFRRSADHIQQNPKKPTAAILEALKFYSGGILIVIIPVAFYFLSVMSFKDLFFHLIWYPLTMTSQVSYLYYPGLFSGFSHIWASKAPAFFYILLLSQNLSFYFPMITGLLTMFLGVSKVSQKQIFWTDMRTWALFYFFLLGILYFNQTIVRSDMTHLLPVMLPSTIIFFIVYEQLKINRIWRMVQVGIIVIMLFLPVYQKINDIKLMRCLKEKMFEFHLERAKGIFVDKYGKYAEEAIRYIQHVVPEGERIYVGQSRHDKILVCDVMFYFLANRHSATRYHGWIITTRPAQEEVIEGLKRYKVNYIVIREDKYIVNEPNETSKSSGVVLLDDYIKENFSIDQRFDNYFILKRKDFSPSVRQFK